MCSYWKNPKKRRISLSTVKSILPFLKKYKVKVVMLTGGEPTLHPDFVTIVKLLKKGGHKVSIVTNGLWPDGLIYKVKDDIASVLVSLDADDERLYEQIRGVDSFTKVIGFIRELKRLNVPVGLCCVIQKKNYSRLPSIFNLAVQLKVNSLYFTLPEIRGGCFGREESLSEQEITNILLDKEDILEFRSIVEELLLLNKSKGPIIVPTDDNLLAAIEYFKYWAGEPSKLQPSHCPVPFLSAVIDENECVKCCFYLPFSHHYQCGEDPFNTKDIIEFRKRLLSDDEGLTDTCKVCHQFIRKNPYERETRS